MSQRRDLEIILNEIAERLYSGHASIMIGAGFSKNAVANSEESKPFLNWNELADVFYEKLYGKPPAREDRYLNPIKLAEELKATFGRPVLDKILLDYLPDQEYEPSELHKKMVRLPWSNVFTTNYDTLLERATKNSEQRYDVVINQKDLVYSRRPRIVKLHGSFPSGKPFIISEEDYRTYPKKYPLYVNTVQQALVENTLCLIGFSGDDPNFLHWIGWIRDNIGVEHSPKIFLIGIFDIPDSQRKLLEQRNLTIVDLSPLCGKSKNRHKDSLNSFLDYLKNKEKEENRISWPSGKSKHSPDFSQKNEDEFIKQIEEVTNEWRDDRNSYPGWVICPYENRKKLKSYTSHWLFGEHLKKDTTSEVMLRFWYELIWRHEKCLLPMWDHLADKIAEVIESSEKLIQKKNNNAPELLKMWIHLYLALLRYMREEGKLADWGKLYKKLSKYSQVKSEGFSVRILFEEAYFYLFSLDFNKLRISLDKLKNFSLTAFEKARLASLLSELGLYEDAHILLEESLLSVREAQNLRPVTGDYSLLSQESYILQISKMIKDGIERINNRETQTPIKKYYNDLLREHNKYQLQENEEEPTNSELAKNKTYIDEYMSRWNRLKEYRCDPWGELEVFRLKLEDEPIPYSRVSIINSFDIGYSSVNEKLGGDDPELLIAFNFFRYVEDIAIPLKVNFFVFGQECVTGAALRLKNEVPFWSLILASRSGNNKVLPKLIDREAVAEIHYEKAEIMLSFWLERLVSSEKIISLSDSWKDSNMGLRIATIAPEIISRLVVKCSFDSKKKILDFLSKVYNSNFKRNYNGIKELVKRLITSWPYEEYSYLVQYLLDNFPLPEKQDVRTANDFPDPFLSLDIKFFDKSQVTLDVKKTSIQKYLREFEFATDDYRSELFFRLSVLHDLGIMTKDLKEQFGVCLWAKKESNGFPLLSGYVNYFWFLGLPAPNSIDVFSLYKEYLSGLKPSLQVEGAGVTFGGREHEFIREFLGCRSYLGKKIQWESKDAGNLLKDILVWFKSDSHYLLEDDSIHFLGGKKKEFQKRFFQASKILAYDVIPFLNEKDSKSYKEDIENIILILTTNDVSVSLLLTKMLCSAYLQDKSYLDIVWSELHLKDTDFCYRGIIALTEMLELYFKSEEQRELFDRCLNLLVDFIYYRTYPHLISALLNVSYLIKVGDVSHFSDIVITKILNGLECLLKETLPNTELESGSYYERLQAREAGAELASVLFHKFHALNLDIPHQLKSWESNCMDNNEFIEIRKAWVLGSY